MASFKTSGGHPLGAGWAVPALIDCWHLRDLQRFRAVLKGGQGAAVQLSTSANVSTAPGPRSPTSHGSYHNGSLAPAPPAEVNRRDHAGRTALHHIASSDEGISIDFLLAILAHPSCNVNIQDTESGWTALHRALYHGNLNHALTLLRHSNIDLRVKDLEGLTPFDLYNSTVAGTNPAPLTGAEAFNIDVRGGDLLLWGSNRNFTLGLGDGNDRSLPDLITLARQDVRANLPPGRRFDPVKVKDVQMSRMHTVVLTQDKASGLGNVWVAGIGSNGRLGRAPSTQPTLQPLQDFKEHASRVAVGPDHTLIVTTAGAVYSFGSNRFGTLGYAIEEGQGQVASSSGASSGVGGAGAATFGSGGSIPQPYNDRTSKVLDVQITPRRVLGSLKKEVVLGAASSKLHSAVFTHDALYTWGSNTGQLGYDKAATPLQITPRKVTSLTAAQSIRQIACTDHATALLLNTFDVLVLHGDVNFKLSFPMTRFNDKMSAGVFRPPQAQPKPSIAKLTSSGNTFAALSDYGDLFTFSLDHPSEYAKSGGKRAPAPEPQLVWSVRKKFTAVRDVAIGLDGSIILCTSSGHVFVRSRRSAGDAKQSSKSGAARAFKFAQIPLLQRVVKVATNENGSFAALRSQAPLREIRTKGKALEDDLRDILPHLQVWSTGADGPGADQSQQGRRITADIGHDLAEVEDDEVLDDDERGLPRTYGSEDEDDDGAGDEGTSDSVEDTPERHAQQVLLILEAAKRFERVATAAVSDVQLPFGCDLILIAGGRHLAAHRCIVSARIQRLSSLLENPPTKGAANAPEGVVVKKISDTLTTLTLPGCSFHTGLFLLHYLYTDDLPAIWTASIGLRVEKQLAAAKVNRATVQSQLRELASILALPALTPVFNSPAPRSPTPTLRADMLSFFKHSVASADLATDDNSSPLHDVELQLADRTIPAHSVLLRRSPFFSALLLPDWSASRWDSGKLRIDLRHLRWEVLSVFLRHIYTDEGQEAFAGLDVELKVDDWIDFLTETLAGGNEFLLDRFKLICASLLRNRISQHNIAAMLTIADMYYSIPLKDTSLLYCAQNLESLLEGGMLDELDHKMVRELSSFIKKKQDDKMHRTRESDHIAALILKHQEFYDALDIPPPSLNLVSHRVGKRPPRSAEALAALESGGKKAARKAASRPGGSASPTASPALRPSTAHLSSQDSGMFDMDDDDVVDSPSLGAMAANLSLGDAQRQQQPPSLGLPPAVASAPWTTAGTNGRHRPTSPRGALSASGSATPSGQAAAGAGDFRSIMAAELARSRGSAASSSASPAVPGTPRRLASGTTPLSSVPNSGTATPVRGAVTPQTPQQSAGSGSKVGSLAPEATQTTVSPSPMAKMSQRDRKKQQALALAQAQEQALTAASAHQSTSPSAVQGSPWKQVSSGGGSGGGGANAAAAAATPTRPPLRQGFSTQLEGGGGPSSAAARRSVSDAMWRSAGNASAAAPGPSSALSSSRPLSAVQSSRSASSSSGAPSPMLRATPVPSSSPTPLSSFAQIQAQQAADAAAAQATPVKKSFMEIQAEETRQAAEREREEKERIEFEAWFEEESRRMREQEGGGGPSGSASRGGKSKQQQKKKRSGVRGDATGPASATAGEGSSSSAGAASQSNKDRKGKQAGGGSGGTNQPPKGPRARRNNAGTGTSSAASAAPPTPTAPSPAPRTGASLSATAAVFSPGRAPAPPS